MAIDATTKGVILGLGTSSAIITDPDADYAILDHENLIGDRVQGSPLKIRGDDYSAGSYDMRPRVEVFYTNSSVPSYTWARPNSGAGEDVQVEVEDSTVLSVTVVDKYVPAISDGFYLITHGLKTGSTRFRVKLYAGATEHFVSEWIEIFVVGPSLYTVEQEAAIKAGARFAQKFSLIYPDGTEVVFHDETDEGDSPVKSVLERGSRENSVINFSPVDDAELESAGYAIVVSNEDQQFSPANSLSFWGGEEPTECRLKHQCYLEVDYAWEELSFLSYTGYISRLFGRGNVRTGVSSYDMETIEVAGRTLMLVKFDESHGRHSDTGLNTTTTI